jgi:hypothetical protein
MQDISSSIDQSATSLQCEAPLHKGRSEEPTTNIADFCNKIGTLLPWRNVGCLVANGPKADVPAEQPNRRE